ncbi:hypothetical protein C0989_002573 [Termitomyces sp. Mn162]|nr:hypothetical protein C0989_002573 [Termitomyces sp. Mn162]
MSIHHRSNSDTFRALSRHETYYLTGGDLFFLVSSISPGIAAAALINTSSRGKAPSSGDNFKSQLRLERYQGARQKELPSFLRSIRTTLRSSYGRYSLYTTSVDDWKVILQLAHKWQFAEVKNLVVRELEKLDMSDVDRIATYQDHEVDKNYLIPRYAALCEREQPLTLEEGVQLGMATTLMIARAREYARSNPSADGSRSPTTAGIREEEMHSLVRLLFDIRPPVPVNKDDNANGTTPGTGTGIPTGGLVTTSNMLRHDLLIILCSIDTSPTAPKGASGGNPTDETTGGQANGHTNGKTDGPTDAVVNGASGQDGERNEGTPGEDEKKDSVNSPNPLGDDNGPSPPDTPSGAKAGRKTSSGRNKNRS